ncbi:MAG TPA: hypothetical protein VLV78_03315 [Thermoanaerobaculia bacterium]|nr:hypothetical protein [Thermoanaerobaculia bacterium]
MRRTRDQRGEGQFGCLVGLVLVLIGLFIAYKIVPVKVRAAELRQEVVDQAKSAGMRGDEKILAAILRKAEDNNLPVSAENVTIRRSQNSISVDVDYTVPVIFPGYTYNMEFHHHADNPLF